jgi:hypothetical protein
MTLRDAQRVPRREDCSARRACDVADVRYVVRLDLEALRRCLSKADRTTYALDNVKQWLRDAGFRPTADGWVVRADDLGQVEPSEVLEIAEWHGPLPS